MSGIHDFSATALDGREQPLSDYKGKAVLIVNTASKCGFTPQFEALQKLYLAYKDKGLEILGFPCNQFANQDPGTNEEIGAFCQRKYDVSFPMFAKIDVNGMDADPLFVWLKERFPEDEGDEEAKAFERKVKVLKPFAKRGDIKWNFGKFLIDRKGNPVGRFSPAMTPEKLTAEIEKLL